MFHSFTLQYGYAFGNTFGPVCDVIPAKSGGLFLAVCLKRSSAGATSVAYEA